MTAPSCPIRGHQHDTVLVASHRQAGTGAEASTFECPTGRYRWFQLAAHAGRPLSDATRQRRPRWGWR